MQKSQRHRQREYVCEAMQSIGKETMESLENESTDVIKSPSGTTRKTHLKSNCPLDTYWNWWSCNPLSHSLLSFFLFVFLLTFFSYTKELGKRSMAARRFILWAKRLYELCLNFEHSNLNKFKIQMRFSPQKTRITDTIYLFKMFTQKWTSTRNELRNLFTPTG